MRRKLLFLMFLMTFLASPALACNDPKNPQCPNFDVTLVNWNDNSIWTNQSFYSNLDIRNDPRFYNSDYFQASIDMEVNPQMYYSPSNSVGASSRSVSRSSAEASNSLTIEDLREFITVAFKYASLPNQQAPETGAPRFRSVEELVRYQKVFTREQINAMWDALPEKPELVVTPCAKGDVQDEVRVILNRPENWPEQKVMAYIESEGSEKTRSISIFVAALKAASDSGANVLAYGNEGTTAKTKTYGFGIGFAYVNSQISGNVAQATSAGPGFTMAGVSADKNPFGQFQALYVK